MPEKTDQVSEEVKTDQTPENNQNEEPKEEPITAERAFELARGLQKGYTQTRQEIAEIRDNLQTIADSVNKQSEVTPENEEYLTVGKLKEVLAERTQAEVKAKENQQVQADSYIETTLAELKTDGIVKTKEDEDALIQYALDKKESDLFKAAERWQEIKQAREEGKKEAAKTKVKQEEGSIIGTSSKTSGEESRGLDYAKVQQIKRDWGF